MRAKIFRGTVLLVTGNDHLKNSLQHALVQAGYGIRVSRDQEDGLQELHRTTPSILIVDRRESGFSRLHGEGCLAPPIVTIAYHSEACDERHCVIDLEDGACRAVCNASPAMIVALVGAVLRRRIWERPAPDRYMADGIVVDIPNYQVTADATPIPLTPIEFRILRSLVSAPGYYLSRRSLLNQVWGEGFAILPHALNVHIFSLRRKLNLDGSRPNFLMTVRGLGFKLQSMALRAEALPDQSYRSTAQATRHPSLIDYPSRSQAVTVPELRCFNRRREQPHTATARYRSNPLASDRTTAGAKRHGCVSDLL
jgi:DNA-binding response OmpR family regulator